MQWIFFPYSYILEGMAQPNLSTQDWYPDSQFPLYDLHPAAKQLLQLSNTQLQTSDCDIDNHHHEDFDTLRDGSSWVGDIPGGSEGFDHDPPWRGWPQQPASQQGLSVSVSVLVCLFLSVSLVISLSPFPIPLLQ